MSDTLFDTTPERDRDVGKKKPARRHRTTAPPPAEADLPAALPTRRDGEFILERAGVVEDEVCPSCGASRWDILDVHRGEWRVQCDGCGLLLWRPEIPGHIQEKAPEFRFRDGRLAGLTPAEAAEQPRGLDTMRLYARSHADESVREACRSFLDTTKAAR